MKFKPEMEKDAQEAHPGDRCAGDGPLSRLRPQATHRLCSDGCAVTAVPSTCDVFGYSADAWVKSLLVAFGAQTGLVEENSLN